MSSEQNARSGEYKQSSLEERLRYIEDRLAIYNLIASHPPSADTSSKSHIRSMFVEDGVLDLGGSKVASGNDAISELSQRPAHQDAIHSGLAHFAGLPYVQINGDEAIAISYLQIVTPDQLAEEVEVPAHGISRGYRIHRIGANKWALTRTPQGWKIKRRVYRSLDGSDPRLIFCARHSGPTPKPARYPCNKCDDFKRSRALTLVVSRAFVRLTIALGLLWTPIVTTAMAQNTTTQAWPHKTVRIVVGFAAGGNFSNLARLTVDYLTKVFGEQFIVENRPGAMGTLAANSVVHAAPDGYTFFWPALGQFRFIRPCTLFPTIRRPTSCPSP